MSSEIFGEVVAPKTTGFWTGVCVVVVLDVRSMCCKSVGGWDIEGRGTNKALEYVLNLLRGQMGQAKRPLGNDIGPVVVKIGGLM